MRRVIVFIVVVSLAVRYAQAAGTLWIDPTPEDLDSLNIYYCEDLSPGDTVITLLGASQIDTTFSITIENADANSVFGIDGNDLKIKPDANTSKYGFEAEINITHVTATLTYINGLDREEITVNLVAEEVNEFPPTFENNTYEVSVSAIASPGVSVLKVTAIDADATSSVSYQILEEYNYTGFLIHPDTGLITYFPADAFQGLREVITLTLRVQATDGNSLDSRNGNSTVVVNFIPVPMFIELSSAKDVFVDENTVDVIFTVNYTTAIDVDYELTIFDQTCDPPYFELVGNDVRTAANQSLDKETFNEPCTLTFRLSDGVNVVNSKTLSVNLNEINDNYPVFSEYNPTLKISVSYPVGTSIYQAKATDADIGNLDDAMIYSLSGDGNEMFSIDRLSGVITIAAQLNYDTKNEYNLTLTAADNGEEPLTATTYLHLLVITGPKFEFPVDGDNIMIDEVDTGVGSSVTSLTVVDKDGDTPVITIVEQYPSDLFELSGNDLIWTQAVDFDDDYAEKSNRITLRASDGDNRTPDDEIVCTFYVQDNNDELPVFVNQSYNETVGEHSTVGTTVLTVEANDRDVTFDYSKLVYSLTSDDDSHTDFNIDTGTGVISVAKALNYSLIPTYRLTAVAKDISTYPKSSTASVTIYVATGPKFEFPMDEDNIMIAEVDTGVGSTVTSLTVVDKDGDTPVITIIEQYPSDLFELSGNDLIWTQAVDFDDDYAEKSNRITLRASDGDNRTPDDEIVCTFYVQDNNDELPVFVNQSYNETVGEHSTVGTTVLTVEANDRDFTFDYSKLVYSLTSDDDSHTDFNIDTRTGVISVAKALNYSLIPTYRLTAVAKDISTYPKSSTASVTIYVATGPKFEFPMDGDNIMIAEVDTGVGSTVTSLTVVDKDGDTPVITIVEQYPSDLFELSGNDLIWTQAVDFDDDYAEKSNRITLRASDGDNRTPDDEIVCTFYVQDNNDELPVFVNQSYNETVGEHSTVGTTVLTVEANDRDVTFDYSKLVYSLTSDDDSHTDFTIDTGTGVISVAKALNYSLIPTYRLTAVAKDISTYSKSSTASVTIYVATGPKFEFPMDGDNIMIAEVDTGVGSTVTSLTVVDKDGDTPVITIVEQYPSDLFELSGNDLIWTQAVDFDDDYAEKSNRITLRASDGDNRTPGDEIVCTFYVQDNNDELPVFVNQSYNETVGEHSTVGTTVLTVEANDRDVTFDYSKLVYSLTSDDDSHTDFNIDTGTGVISVAKALNYSLIPTYRLTAVAKDISTYPKSSTASVTIYVATGPKFEFPIDGDNIMIAEVDTGVGSSVTSLTVVDKDGDTPVITIIEQNPGDLFALSGNDLIWTQTVDFEDGNAVLSYTILLRASDGDNRTLDDEIIISINVEDSNDELPVFVNQSYSETVGEHLTVGTSVLTVEANDRDVTNDFSQLVYSLTSEIEWFEKRTVWIQLNEFDNGDHTDFSIDTDTGVIIVTKALSYSLIPTYRLTAVATDISNDPKSSTVPVTIYVATGPEITSPQNGGVFIISEEDTENGTPVFTVETIDEDEIGTTKVEVISQTPATEPFIFEINSNGQLVPLQLVATDLGEEDHVFTLQIRASDGRPYSSDYTITVKVQVGDSNDAPIFPESVESIEVPERTEIGSIVYQANASDPDKTAEFRQILYTLPGNPKDFKIFENGSLAILKQLDYSVARTHDLTIRASNTPDLQLYTTMYLIIYVLTAPEFDNLKEPRTVEISENGGIENIFRLEVSDEDGKVRNTEVVTSIESPSPSMKFVLEGLILQTTGQGLDAEEGHEYMVTFKANDTEFVTYSAGLIVKVIDLNDNSPVIEDVGDITVDENKATSGSGSEIVLVEATDGDATTANNMLSWTIISGNEDNYFSINKTTGMLSLVKTPVSQEPLEYTLTVEVADNGSPQNKESTNFKISINDEAVDECAESLCLNGGECTSYTNTYICECADGFKGDHCEINIDDCSTNPCNNVGICIDGINSFSCDCAKGWTGNTCSEECSNSRYGRNCADTCDCDELRLAADAGNQVCNVKTGDCKCNEFWRGRKCEDDINECEENLHNCNNDPNSMCKNAKGSFSCICKKKHTLVDNVCKKDPTRSVLPKDGEVAIVLKCKLDLPCPNIDDPEIYIQEEEKIIISVHRKLKKALVVFVVDIWCGSLEFEATIITTDTEGDRAELAKEIQEIRDASSIQYAGNDVPVLNVFVNDKELSPTSQSSETMETKVCDVFTSYTTCSTDEECRYEDGKPSCVPLKTASDNLALILGLGLGLSLPLLFLASLAVVLWHMKRRHDLKRRRWERKMMPTRDGSFATRYYDNKYNENISHLSDFSNLPGEAVFTYPYKISE